MTLRDAFRGFMQGLQQTPGMAQAPSNRPPINVIPGAGELQVVDTSQLPTNANIPGSWGRAMMGPGMPFSITGDTTARSQDAETEPRTFEYYTGINSTMSPRKAYGLTPFTDLRNYAETVPEVAMCVRLLTEEMKAFVPKIVDAKGDDAPDTTYQWMVERPDGFNPFSVWMSRFLYNVLVYDAGCAYFMRDSRKKIRGSRVIDGSTIFVLIDQQGEQPKPPAPAFQQIIWGVPRIFLNTRQMWYKPRHLRADAPYGRSPIEDALPAVKLLGSLWDYEYLKYQVGNIPEMVFTVPESWRDSADAILEFETAYNARMAGSLEERVRARFMPAGTTVLNTKELTFNKEGYDSSVNAVRLAFGIPQSEVGESPGAGLGGSGYAEAMQSTFYRMGLAPLMAYVESHFNDILKMNGNDVLKFKLDFPSETLDPQKEEEKFSTRFQIGGITRDEYRQGIGMKEMGGEQGEFIVQPGGQSGEEEGGDPFGGLMGGGGGAKPGMINVGNKNNVQVRRPISVAQKPVKVVKKPISVYKGDGFSTDRAKQIGDGMGVDWSLVDLEEFARGVNEEREHADTVGNDVETIAQIALDHLAEDPQYYTKLKALFAKYEAGDLQKYCGVDAGDDMLFGSPVVQDIDVDMPKQGANESQIVSIGGGPELDARPAVWKPVTGESEKLKNWVHGDLYRRSEAAYLLDRELAPDEKHYLVPLTYITQVDGIEGSVQHYVIGRQPRVDVSYYGSEWVEQAAVLDFIMGQMDRARKNWLTHPHDDDRPILIDSDLSFSPDKKQKVRSSFVDAMKERQLSQKTLDSIYTALGNRDLWEDLADILEDDEAVANARERAEQLYDAGRIGITTPIKVINADESSEPASDDMIMVKADWEESKHPRANDGKFTSGAGGGGAQAAPASAPKRIGTTTVQRAKDIIEARRIQDEEEAKAKAGGAGHVVHMRTSEKEEWEKLKREKADRKMSQENHELARKSWRVIKNQMTDGAVDAINMGDNGLGNAFTQAANEAREMQWHHEALAQGRKGDPAVLDAAQIANRMDHIQVMQDFLNAKVIGDKDGMNVARRKMGLKSIHTPKPPTPAKPAKPVKFKGGGAPEPNPQRPPDLAGHALVKNPHRIHTHQDTQEKKDALKNFKDWVETLDVDATRNVSEVEFYGKICQSGADFDGVRALIHVDGGMTDAQKRWNEAGHVNYWADQHFAFRFVSDWDNNDKKDVEKIRRDNRDNRLGHTSIHAVTQGMHLHIRGFGRQPETAGGTHGTEALKLKANPGAHIWDKLKDLKGGAGGGGKPPAGGGKPNNGQTLDIQLAERPFTSEHKREVLQHFATGKAVSQTPNGNRGVNTSYWIKIENNGTGLMKGWDNRGLYGFPHVEVLASDISETMGFTCVPATGFRDDPKHGRCSVMEKMEGNLTVGGITNSRHSTKAAHETLSQMLVLTTITGNTDRHRGNFMVNEDTGEFIAIDNGFSCKSAVLEEPDPKRPENYRRRASSGYGRAMDSTYSSGLIEQSFKIKKAHIDAAVDFIEGDGGKKMDASLRRIFHSAEFCTQMRKNGDGYSGKTDAEVEEIAVERAKLQLRGGLDFLRNDANVRRE